MSGYPTPPGLRMAYDRDGSIGFIVSGSGFPTALVLADLQAMNDENDGTQSASFASNGWVGIMFPELRTLVGIFAALDGGFTTFIVQTSTDTTNGADGTWTTVTNTGGYTSNSGLYRSNIGVLTGAVTSVKAIRCTDGNSHYAKTLHLYGNKSAAGDTLEWWNNTTDVIASASSFDFGDAPRGSTATVTVRVKNRSTTKVATTITIADAALTDPTPSILTQYTFSTDGTTFGSTATIASLAANTISGLIYIKRITPSGAAVGPHAIQLSATAATFA